MSITTFGRKVTRFEHDNAIKRNPQSLDNSWNSLCLEVTEGNHNHFLKVLATRPKSEKQTNWMPNVVALTILLNKLRESQVPQPEIYFFPLGSRVIYKDKAKLPDLHVLRGEPTREIGFHNLQSIDELFFDKGFSVQNNAVSFRAKEILDVRDVQTRDITGQREIFYKVDLSLEGLDPITALSLVRG